jgi:hypothetical protein
MHETELGERPLEKEIATPLLMKILTKYQASQSEHHHPGS